MGTGGDASGEALEWLAFGAVLVPVVIVLVWAVLGVPLLAALRALARRRRRRRGLRRG